MAKKKGKRFTFELGIPGLIFVTGLLICLFLWMFILGFWLGQRMVTSKAKEAPVSKETLKAKKVSPPLVTEEMKAPVVVPEKAPGEIPEKPSIELPEKSIEEKPLPAPKTVPPKEAPTKSAAKKPKPATKAPTKPKATKPKETKAKKVSKTHPFFTLQVASFRSPREAQRYARMLGDRGYEAFVKRVNLPKKGVWYRVYVGRFKTFQEAKDFGRVLQKKEKIKTFYITRLGG